MAYARNQGIVNTNVLPIAAKEMSAKSWSADSSIGSYSRHSTALRLLLCVFELIQVWQERAQSRRALLRLNKHLLDDIGLTRLDATIESTKPFWKQ